MGEYDIETAYNLLMSPYPYSQSSGAAMLRNFGTAAQLMAMNLRKTASTASPAGTAGAATADQAEAHAQWFDQVATNSSRAADDLDKLAAQGNQHQNTAETVYANYKQAVAADSKPNAMGGQDMAVIHQSQSGSNTLSSAVNEWGQSYSAFKAPAPPPVPKAAGSGEGASSSGTSSAGFGSSSGSDRAPGAVSGTSEEATLIVPTSTMYDSGTTPTHVTDRGPGVTGSVEVGPDGGDFAGWYKDPNTGYYVDPATGREFDPASNRWIDPVTGKPFGDVAQYATSLQGLGPAATSGGLLSDTAGSLGAGAAGLPAGGGAAGAAGGGFAGLFSGVGNSVGIAGAYGGVLPPSLAANSGASPALWQRAGQSLATKQSVAENLIAREQAVRAGRPYLPPTQAGGAAAGLGAAGRSRPGYLNAEEEEAALFRSPGRAGSGRLGALAEEEAAMARGAALAEEEGLLAGSVHGAGSPVGLGTTSARFGAVGARSGLGAQEEAGLGGGARGGSGGARATGAAAEEAEAAGLGGRRAYLPPTQAGGAGSDKRGKRERPSWLVDDDVFATDDAPEGVLDSSS